MGQRLIRLKAYNEDGTHKIRVFRSMVFAQGFIRMRELRGGAPVEFLD